MQSAEGEGVKILIIDGNNAAWRLMKRLPDLSVKGQPIQMVYGFMRLLRSALVDFTPDAVLVCWDKGRSAWRRKVYPNYKANRSHDRNEKDRKEFSSFSKQVELVSELLVKLNVAQAAYPDTEADDLMGAACDCLDGEKIVISSDRDVLHLVRKGVTVWSPNNKTLYTEKNFYAKVGMTPTQWLEFRALTGDSGDNIPGAAKGFGETSARELIKKYGTIEEIFRHSVQARIQKKGNRYALICNEEARQQVYMNLILMDLRSIVLRPGHDEIENLIQKSVAGRHEVRRAEIQRYFLEKKFMSLLKDLAKWIGPFEDLDS
jgi:5'-3' exonuclease